MVPPSVEHHPVRHAAAHTDEYLYSQLIPYLGNKRKLLGLIDRGIRATGIASGTFADLFTGTTVVARLAKLRGFRVLANDWEPYSHEIALGTVVPGTPPAFAPLGGAAAVFARLNDLEPIDGYVARHLCPADDEHPFGHHKAEYFSSGFEGALILVAALAIIWAAVERFRAPQPLESLGWGLGLSVLSSALNAALAWAMLRKAREHRSIALEADARHLFTDVWTSAGVVLGLLAVMATGWLWLDPLVAIAVALNIVREGVALLRRSVDGLMDRALEPQVQAQIEQVLDGFRHHVLRFDHVATRRAGARRFVELHMHLPGQWSLGRAAALLGDVEQALMSAVPGLRATRTVSRTRTTSTRFRAEATERAGKPQ